VAEVKRPIDLNNDKDEDEDFMTFDDNYYDPPGGVPNSPWEQ
jgi:hypothetical protein